MNIDKNKLDELFSEEESAAVKSRFKSKGKPQAKSDSEPLIQDGSQEIAPADTADLGDDYDAADDAYEIPEEEKIVITPNTNKVTATVFDWLGSLLIALVCVLIVMTFCFRIIDVDGTSMEPTLINTDKVVITDLFYTPHNGDVIVISHGEEYPKPLVKRVIAIPGQTLRLDFEKNEVYVDGVKLDEPYIQGYLKQADKSAEEINGVIPEGKLFVMGDNRTVSLDSRSKSIGLIDIDCVIGKAQLVVIPHSYSDNGSTKLDLTRIRYIYE